MQSLNIENATLYFLPSHSIALFAFFFLKKESFYKILPYFVIFTAILTCIFPFFTKQYQILLPLLGIFSSAFVINATLSLKVSKNPVFTALLGFVFASLIQLSLCFVAISNIYIMFFLASLLPLFSLKKVNETEIIIKEDVNCFIYSPFVFFFYMVGGIMYSFIMPQYVRVCIFEGFEIFYYIFAIFVGFILVKFDKIFAIFGGILFGMLAFSLFKVEKSLFLNTSMIFLQSAFGFVEIFLVALVISRKESIKAIAVIFSSMCLGILSGILVTLYLHDFSDIIATYGNISLVISTMILLIIERKKVIITKIPIKKESTIFAADEALTPAKPATDSTDNKVIQNNQNANANILPENNYVKALKKRLSQKEFIVLENILQKKTYKEVAAFLGISESTVKTYVRRIYEKENVKGIDKLLERIFK